MNVVRLQEALSQRYNTHWTGLRTKITTRSKLGSICSYCNHLSSRPVGQTMQKTLKAKIQNAITLSSCNDAESPALFVGGRRRNRKKRKNKHGQAKRKAKKGVPATPAIVKPSTPDSAYEELLPIYSVKKPIVSCLDVLEPVFYDPVTSSITRVGEGSDSVYSSSDSLVSLTSEHDSGIETAIYTTVEEIRSTEDVKEKKIGFPRTHSNDSGVYDDETVEDAGYEDGLEDDPEEAITDDAFENDEPADEIFAEVFKDDEQVIEQVESIQSTDHALKDPGEFDEIDLRDEPVKQIQDITEEHTHDDDDHEVNSEDTSIVVDCEGIDSIRELKNITEAISFVEFDSQEEEDDIIFDLSQLEVNNTQEEFSKIPKNDVTFKLSEVLDDPTDLEENVPIRVPMDMLIDDDDNEEVLFEAKKKDLCITCNPLYEHTLREEEERISIKSYQSGFKTDFDNINLIQIPTTSSNKASVKSLKESSPLMQSQQAGRDEDNELACCVIL